jgi:thymidylate kinase
MAGRFLRVSLQRRISALASLAYAYRIGQKRKWMFGYRTAVIVSNRYATSNMAHQGARLPEDKR